ncbi:MAG: iron-sulfur cluster assembly accessory protein [Magnetospirillum sp.]|nr:iron-sulfur cluster assembly accessory protein [Magnetospirillum sp.]
MLNLTDKAVDVIREVCNGEYSGLRIMVQKGCSGFSYNMGLEESAAEDDQVLEFSDVKVFIDPGSALWLTGATMDYVDNSSMGSGFVFDNPNQPPPENKSACSCSVKSCG